MIIKNWNEPLKNSNTFFMELFSTHTWSTALRGSRNGRLVARDWLMAKLILHGGETPSSSKFDDGSWSQQAFLHLLFKMVPSIADESARIVGTHFSTKIKKFASCFEPNRALFWGNDFEFIFVMINYFQRYIICLCLKLFEKSHVFIAWPTGT